MKTKSKNTSELFFHELKKKLIAHGYDDFEALYKLFIASDRNYYLKQINFTEIFINEEISNIDISLSMIFHGKIQTISSYDRSHSILEVDLLSSLAALLPLCREPACMITGKPFIGMDILENNTRFLYTISGLYLDENPNILFNLWKFAYHVKFLSRLTRDFLPNTELLENKANEHIREEMANYKKLFKNQNYTTMHKQSAPYVNDGF